MDDFLGSIADPNEALNLSKESVSLLSLRGFRLTKLVSNLPDLAEKLNPELNKNCKRKNLNDTATRVLGLMCDN